MTTKEIKLSVATAKELMAQDPDWMRELVRGLLQEMLEAEMTEALGASKSERIAGRMGYRSGYYDRTLVTRVGKLELRVPQDREVIFRPSCSSAISAPGKPSSPRWPRCTCKACRRGK
jgi:putative transposase